MNKKTPNKFTLSAKRLRLGEFFRNFAAVVLGIVITFAGSAIIQNHNTKKDVKKSIELIKSELLLNRTILEEVASRVELEQKGAQYLLQFKDRMNEASQDSLNLYGVLPFQWTQFLFIFDALEMVKASAMIQKIDDKELALQIIKAYDAIRSSEKSFQKFSDIKIKLSDDMVANTAIKQFNDSDEEDLRKIWDFYIKQPEALSMIRQIPQIQSTRIYTNSIKTINQVLKAIEKEYNLSPTSPQAPQDAQ